MFIWSFLCYMHQTTNQFPSMVQSACTLCTFSIWELFHLPRAVRFRSPVQMSLDNRLFLAWNQQSGTTIKRIGNFICWRTSNWASKYLVSNIEKPNQVLIPAERKKEKSEIGTLMPLKNNCKEYWQLSSPTR